MQNARAFGEIDHPPSWSPGFRSLSLETVSHVVLQLEWRGACLVGLVEILDTPAGRMLRDLYLQGKRLGVSSRSWATLNRKGSATFIGDDLDLIAFDYVSEPSTYGALMEPILERCLEPAHDHSALVCEAERASRFARRAFGKWTEKALRKRGGRNEGTAGGGQRKAWRKRSPARQKTGRRAGGRGRRGCPQLRSPNHQAPKAGTACPPGRRRQNARTPLSPPPAGLACFGATLPAARARPRSKKSGRETASTPNPRLPPPEPPPVRPRIVRGE